jgi:hypothetical protein
MIPLFGNELAPLTLLIGFLEAPIATILDAYLHWIEPHFTQITTCATTVDLKDSLRRLEPLSTPPRRFLLFSTDSKWTAYFDNGTNGPDPFPPIGYLAERVGCRGLVVTCIPHSLRMDAGKERGTYGAVRFELFGPSQRGFLNRERSVGIVYDEKWRFEDEGTVQPFEDVSRYTADRVADRFSPEMLDRYCNALGVRAFDEHYYTGPGWLIAIGDPLPSESKRLSLDEAKQRLSLARGPQEDREEPVE